MRKKGFTLVEVLVATVILVIVIGAVTAVETSNIKIDSSNKYQIQANGVGQEGVAILRSLNDAKALGLADGQNLTDTTKFPSGAVYYINPSNQLTPCATPTPVTINGQSTKVCTDSGAKVGSTGFTRTVIMP